MLIRFWPWSRFAAYERRIARLMMEISALDARAFVAHQAHETARLNAFHDGYKRGAAETLAALEVREETR